MTRWGGIGEGGGIAYEGTGPLSVQNSTVAQNSAIGGTGGPHAGGGAKGGAAEGGGIFNPSNLILTGSTVTANTATGGAQGVPASPTTSGGPADGGGVFSQEGADTLVNTTIVANVAQGGAAGQGGSAAPARGGGLFAEGSAGGAALQSDTFEANQPVNLYVAVGTSAPYPFTVHDTIVAGAVPADCVINTPPSSESYNLEDDAAGSCGFAPVSHDLIGISAQLASALADNGGATQTLAPAPGSPVLGAGGQCSDPTSTPPNQPLTIDQRGEPRSMPCDIGAFQGQRPRDTTPPAITGTAKRGSTLICSQGVWTGDGSLEYAFQWLRNGSPVAGATTNSYVIGTSDPGQSLACRVTATYYGVATAGSQSVTVTSNPVITLLRVTAHGAGVAIDLGCRGAGIERCAGRMQLSVVERLRGSKIVAVAARVRTVHVGQRSYSLVARHVATITIALRQNGLRLLKRFGRLPLLLTLTQTTAAGTARVGTWKLNLRPTAARRRRG